MYKISYRIHCTTQGICPISYNIYKWSITFKHCETLHFIPITYNTLHEPHFNKKRKNVKMQILQGGTCIKTNTKVKITGIINRPDKYFHF